MGEVFLNNNHLGEWIRKAEEIRTTQGTATALSYLIGEKFFNLASLRRSFRDEFAVNATREHLLVCDAASTCSRQFGQPAGPHDRNTTALREIEDMLAEFATLINQSFEPYLVRGYFADVYHGATPESIRGTRTWPSDASPDPSAIWKDMMKYLSME